MFLSTAAGKTIPSAIRHAWNLRQRHSRRYFQTTRRLLSSKPATAATNNVFDKFRAIVGDSNVLDGTRETTQTAAYLKGTRLGRGRALAIAKPTRLSQVPLLLQAAVDANCVVVVQGSNTGLTGGSVPRNNTNSDERPTIIINTKHLDTIVTIDGGTRVLCLAGVGLASLQSFVSTKIKGRQSHSTLGSTFLNPTTAAGVAFGSGGTQIRKGPSTTERALYLRVDESTNDNGTSKQPVVKVVNTLGICGLDDIEGEFEYQNTHASKEVDDDVSKDNVLQRLDAIVEGDMDDKTTSTTSFTSNDTYGKHPSHDENYQNELCTFDENLTRYNADTKGLDCNRSEGKVLILATIHDTFEEPDCTKSYWLSFEDLDTTTKFKERVALTNPNELPESIEYMDRGCFEIIDRAGRFMGQFIKYFGTVSPYVSKGWDVKLRIEALPGMATLPDRVQYHLNNWFPPILPKVIMDMGNDPNRHHHIAITVGNYGNSNNNMESFETRLAQFCRDHDGKVDFHELANETETNSVNAFRYVAAAAFPTYCVGNNLQGISVDYALPKNNSEAPKLPRQPTKRMRYSHFGCNVVHEDLAYEQGIDTHEAKMQLKHIVDEVCHGRLPSEHGHGTEYKAPAETKERWRKMDPFNVMNPGVGGLSTKYRYE